MATHGLLKLGATNFRSLRSVDVPLGPLNALVGPNGAGKSNFLDVIRFLGDAARFDLVTAVAQRGGYRQLRFRGRTTGPVRISVQANVTRYASTKARDEYDLSFSAARSSRPGALTREESFKFKRTKGQGRRITARGRAVDIRSEDQMAAGQQLERIDVESETLVLSLLPRLSRTEGASEIRRFAELFSTFRVFDVGVDGARGSAPLEDSRSLRPDGSNLAAFLFYLSDRAPDLFDELLEDAREFVPGLKEIEFHDVGLDSSEVVVRLVEQGLTRSTPLSHASYGTIRALALLALLYDPEPPPLTCIEEIDHGLHPYVFDRLVDRLRWASQWSQFIIATHSPALVNRLTADELIVCERDIDGSSRIPAIDSAAVRAMEKEMAGELGLGELWFTGSLGGVPAELSGE